MTQFVADQKDSHKLNKIIKISKYGGGGGDAFDVQRKE